MLKNDPDYCGPLAYEIVLLDNYAPVDYMFTDNATFKYWADVQDETQPFELV